MSTPRKPYGGDSPVTRLKLLWPRLSESQQDYWRQLFDSKMTQAQIRKKIAKELRIALPYDIQITRFREWESDQRDRDHEAEQMKEDERRLTELYPNWTKDQVREDALKKCYLRARARGDASLALRVVAADMKVAAVQTTQEKFKESLRTKLEAGLDELALSLNKNSDALKLYRQMRALIVRETK